MIIEKRDGTDGGAPVDVGQAALEQIYRRMLIDLEWSLRLDRRFRWWMRDFAQEVYVSTPAPSFGHDVSRLVARTPVVVGVPLTTRSYEVLSAFNAAAATLSALVLYGDGVVRLVSTSTVHQNIASWMPDHFALIAAIQAVDAEIKASFFAELLGGRPARSAHPISGTRSEYDDLAGIIKQVVAPRGQSHSAWAGAAMHEAAAVLTNTSLLASYDDTGVTAEFPYRDFSSLLELRTNERHPQVGSGLRVTLRLHTPPLGQSPHEDAALLNLLEARGVCLTSSLHGAWCVAPGQSADTVAFSGFFPNVCYKHGMATNIALWMRGKAEWVASLRDARTSEERWETGKPAIARLMDIVGLPDEEE